MFIEILTLRQKKVIDFDWQIVGIRNNCDVMGEKFFSNQIRIY